MTNSTLFDLLVKEAEQLPHYRYSVGGNAAVMAMRMSQEGCEVLLAASLTSRHLELIAPYTKGIIFLL